jgi:hypothetical protein
MTSVPLPELAMISEPDVVIFEEPLSVTVPFDPASLPMMVSPVTSMPAKSVAKTTPVPVSSTPTMKPLAATALAFSLMVRVLEAATPPSASPTQIYALEVKPALPDIFNKPFPPRPRRKPELVELVLRVAEPIMSNRPE